MADYAAGRPGARDLALCLSLNLTAQERGALRVRLLAGEWNAVLALAAKLRLLPALAQAAEAKGLVAGIPFLRGQGTQLSVAAALADAWSEHIERSAVLRRRLSEVLDALAKQGIRPVLLKGAAALWTGSPTWRSLRDFDLLIPQPATAESVRIIQEMGYRLNVDSTAPAGWHHSAELYRDDLPGWIEVHARGGIRRLELLLPTPHLVAGAVEVAGSDGSTALVLPPALQILHCLCHHHIGHRGDYYDEIDFKGLYEFAADVASLDEAARADLLDAAAQHPRLMASLDLWLAAAADIFRLPVLPPLRLAEDAQSQWSAMARRLDERASTKRAPRRFEGLGRELSMALDGDRLRMVRGGRNAIGRLGLRLDVIRAFAARIV